MSGQTLPSSGQALLEIEQATVGWQVAMQQNQEVTSTTVDQAAQLLMNIYTNANNELSALMKSNTDPTKGMPTDSSNKNTQYSNQIQIWETNYNKVNQEWQNTENNWNTPIQSLSTQIQTLGNNAQEASQVASTITQQCLTTANLLQSQL